MTPRTQSAPDGGKTPNTWRWRPSLRATTAGLGVAAAAVGSCVLNDDPSAWAAPEAPDRPVALVPNAQGYVRVETAAQNVRCSLTTDLVACQSSNVNWPRHPDGTPFAAVSLTAAGAFEAVDADLGQLAGVVTMQDRTYTAQGWTILTSDTGVEFTNERSGHGMSIGDDGVRSF